MNAAELERLKKDRAHAAPRRHQQKQCWCGRCHCNQCQVKRIREKKRGPTHPRKRALMPEHYTRNTESVSAWCHHCRKLTEHTVSDGRIGRCVSDHAAPKLPRANIPAFNVDDLDTDTVEVRPGNLARGRAHISMADRLHIQALDGWQYPQRRKHN